MKISIIIPVHNEKDTIEEILQRIETVKIDKEIIVVDDKSTDGTDMILRKKFSNRPNIKLIFLERNQGKGFAIRTGIPRITGDIAIIQDADLEYDPADYLNIIDAFQKNKAHVVYGSRFMHLNILKYTWCWFVSKLQGTTCPIGHIYLSNFYGIQFLNFLVLILYGKKITDEATCYKAFSSEILKQINLRCMRFEFCPEITAKICKLGYPIYEVPVSYQPRTSAHGKKLNWTDGVVAILTLLKYRFVN